MKRMDTRTVQKSEVPLRIHISCCLDLFAKMLRTLASARMNFCFPWQKCSDEHSDYSELWNTPTVEKDSSGFIGQKSFAHEQYLQTHGTEQHALAAVVVGERSTFSSQVTGSAWRVQASVTQPGNFDSASTALSPACERRHYECIQSFKSDKM